jgi:hypothetical protein
MGTAKSNDRFVNRSQDRFFLRGCAGAFVLPAAPRATRWKVNRAVVDANGTYLHVDDLPQNCYPHSLPKHRVRAGGPSH